MDQFMSLVESRLLKSDMRYVFIWSLLLGFIFYMELHFTYYFVQMTQKGEAVDKMSLWIKSRNPNDHDVLEAIVSL